MWDERFGTSEYIYGTEPLTVLLVYNNRFESLNPTQIVSRSAEIQKSITDKNHPRGYPAKYQKSASQSCPQIELWDDLVMECSQVLLAVQLLVVFPQLPPVKN